MDCLGLRGRAGILLAKPPTNLLWRVCVHWALHSLWCQLSLRVVAGTASTHSGRGTRKEWQVIGPWPPQPFGFLKLLTHLQIHSDQEGSEYSVKRQQDSFPWRPRERMRWRSQLRTLHMPVPCTRVSGPGSEGVLKSAGSLLALVQDWVHLG